MKFTVKEPPTGSVGGDRAKFSEDFFYLSRGEAYPYFGESSVSRFGAVSRGGTQSYFTKIFTESPRRFKELFLRKEQPTILRFSTETVTPFSKESMKQISKSMTYFSAYLFKTQRLSGTPQISLGYPLQ
jgi:hypothetical protein